METYGYLAAVGAAFCWSFTSIFFASAGNRIGSMKVNQIRIVMAVVLLGGMHFVLKGQIIPLDVTRYEVFYLALSGVIGLFIGDMCYFSSLVIIGPKRASVMMTISPAASAVAAYILMNEQLHILSIIGMLITSLGVAVAVSAGKKKALKQSALMIAFGVLLGLLGGAGQGVGIAFAKMGLRTVTDTGELVRELDPLSGTLIRMIAGAACLWIVLLIQELAGYSRKKNSRIAEAVRDKRAMLLIMGGAFVGPFLGVWASLFAAKHAQTAIAMTIMATFPILVIPLTMIIYKERPRLQEIIGAVISVGGVLILFLPDILGLG